MNTGRFGFHNTTEMDENAQNWSTGIIFAVIFPKGGDGKSGSAPHARENPCAAGTEQSSVCAQVQSSEGAAIGEVPASN